MAIKLTGINSFDFYFAVIIHLSSDTSLWIVLLNNMCPYICKFPESRTI